MSPELIDHMKEVIRKVASDVYTQTTCVILARDTVKRIEEEEKAEKQARTPGTGDGDLNDE